MSLSLFTAVVAIAAGQVPLSTQVELPGGEKFQLSSDYLLYEPSLQLLTAKGHAELRSERLSIRADELTYDQANQRAGAKGDVMFVSGTFIAVADQVDVDITSLDATVQGGLFMQKKNVTPEALLSATTPAQLKGLGETVISVSGRHIRRLGPNEFEVDGLAFTPCDCRPTDPSWRIEAKRANLLLGERAILTLPVVYLYSVPVFALPWLYLPLSDRRSGLLVPKPTSTALNGFSIDQPVFITLGPSYDLTLTPGYYAGAKRIDYGGGLFDQPPFGIQGPRLQAELRYTPSEGTSGRATVGFIYDERKIRDPVNPSAYAGSTRLIGDRPRGLRGEASLQHIQDLGSGWTDRIDAAAVSDGYYVKDLVADVLLRENQYLRSVGSIFHRDEDTFAGMDLTLRQDLRWGYNLFDTDVSPWQVGPDGKGLPLHGPNTFNRLPGIRYAIAEKPLGGPFSASGTIEYTRLSPLLHLYGDEGTDGIFNPGAPEADGSQGDRRFEPGEREARDRLDLRPTLSAQVPLDRYAHLTSYLAYRQDFYYGEVTGRSMQRGYPMAGAVLDTELARTYGEGGRLRHAISPKLEVRYVPFILGQGPVVPYDEIDSAISSRGGIQTLVELDQRLSVRTGNQVRHLLRLGLGQGAVLGTETRMGDSFVRTGLNVDHVGFDGIFRYNFPEHRATQMTASLSLDDGKGDLVYFRFDHLVSNGSDRLRQGIDELVGRPSTLPRCDPAPAPITAACWEPAELLTVGGRYQFSSGLGLRYEGLFAPLKILATDPVPEPSYNRLIQQIAGVSYGPACDCWRVEAYAVLHPLSPPYNRLPIPDFHVSLSIARFGSFGN